MSDDDSKKWRCAWCGKPHARNDPPCEECGHHKFERAVVPVAPDNPDHEPEPIWVCPACGREHQKNTPPCSRCGNTTLEKRTPDYSDLEDLGAPSYVDLLEPRYVLGVVVALVAGALLVLGVAGIGPLGGVAGPSLEVSNVPGDAEMIDGLELSALETAYVDELNERRRADDANALERVDRLDDVARFYNQRRVKAIHADGSLPGDDRIAEAIGDACGTPPTLAPFAFDLSSSSLESDTAAASAILDAAPNGAVTVDASRVGVDVHVGPDGQVFVTQLTC